MAIVEFWNSIHEGGRVVVERDDAIDLAALQQGIGEVHEHWRLELAYEPPELVMPVAVWAARLMYRACQFLVHRDIEVPVIEAALAEPAPAKVSANECYSADLSFRILPELIRQARGLADDDPLVLALTKLARAWPLSSVGVPGLSGLNLNAFIDHPSLRRLYVDRIIQQRDESRLSNPRIADAVREAIGAHDDLAPSFSKLLAV